MSKVYSIFAFMFLFVIHIEGQKPHFEFKTQLSDLITLKPKFPSYFGNLTRIIPEVNITKNIKKKYKIDAEVSINTFVNTWFLKRDFDKNNDFSLYRAWLRFSGKHFEYRLGLQKINFGSAQIFRPLMWFDRVDPLDPQKLTSGVWGGLFRYYFDNNANVWLWALIKNKDLKGLEFTPTDSNTPEFGGRIQYPIKKGEISLSYNHRFTDVQNITNTTAFKPENKFGFDFKVDMGIGFLVENSFSNINISRDSFLNTFLMTIGADYTFKVGNGLGFSMEMFYARSKLSYSKMQAINGFFPVAVFTYPVSVLDNVSSVTLFELKGGNLFQFVAWQRTYDHLSFNLMVSLNPADKTSSIALFQSTPYLDGKYLQFLLTYNF